MLNLKQTCICRDSKLAVDPVQTRHSRTMSFRLGTITDRIALVPG